MPFPVFFCGRYDTTTTVSIHDVFDVVRHVSKAIIAAGRL